MNQLNVLHICTPLIESRPLSQWLGKQVFLKMENMQPTGSFKIRGIGRLCQQGQSDGVTRFVASSGGNAGYAAAYAGRKLNIPTTVLVPSTTSPAFRAQIAAQGAEVSVAGDVWDETHAAALCLAQETQALYIPPFDHPLIWQGNSTLVDEIATDIGQPDAVILSVGGGGLLCGVVEGLQRHHWGNTPVLAVETEGTASLAASMKHGRLVTLDKITGVAKTLGAKTVAEQALTYTQQHPVYSAVVTDDQAMQACLDFADEHKCLVEAACGASLAAAYQGHPALKQAKVIVLIVCGGIGVNLEMLQTWRDSLI